MLSLSEQIIFGVFLVTIVAFMFYMLRPKSTVTNNTNNDHSLVKPKLLTGEDRDVRQYLEESITYEEELLKRNERDFQAEAAANRGWYYTICTAVVALWIGSTGLLALFMPFVSINGTLLYLPLVTFLIGLGYVLSSLREVKPDEIAGTDFFGTPLMEFGNGLKFIPRGILNFQHELRAIRQAQFPGDTDAVFWDDEDKDMPDDMVRPIYITFARGQDESDLFNDRLTAGAMFYAGLQLKPKQLYRLIMNITEIDEENKKKLLATITGGEVSDRMLEVFRQARDTGERLLKEIGGKLSLGEMVLYQELVNHLLELRIHNRVITWGITVREAGHSINKGKSLNQILQKTVDAKAEQVSRERAGEGEKSFLTNQGAGQAAAEKAVLTGRGEGYRQMAKDVAAVKAGATVMQLDVAGKLAESEGTIVTEGGVAGLVGTVIAASEKVKKGNTDGSAS